MLCVASHWKATIHIYSLKKFQKIQKFAKAALALVLECYSAKNTLVIEFFSSSSNGP
jgi:hypothetical protein